MKGKCRFYTIEKAALEYEAQLGAPCDCGPHCPKGNRSCWHPLHAWFSFGCQPRSAHSIPCETRMRPCRQAHQPHVPLRRAVANCATLPASAGHLFAADVKNKRGQHARGKKVTGLQFLPTEQGKLLITSNDSRIR